MCSTQILQVVAMIVSAVAAVAGAAAYLGSRYRKAADAEKESYIRILKESKDEALAQCEHLERLNRELEEKNRLLEARVAALEAKVCMLQDLVLRQCREAEKDPVTGACRFCSKGRWYGQLGEVAGP